MAMKIILVPLSKAQKRRVLSKESSWIKASNHYLGVLETASLKCSKTPHWPVVYITGATGDFSNRSKNLWRLIFQVSPTLQTTKYGLAHYSYTQQRESMVP